MKRALRTYHKSLVGEVSANNVCHIILTVIVLESRFRIFNVNVLISVIKRKKNGGKVFLETLRFYFRTISLLAIMIGMLQHFSFTQDSGNPEKIDFIANGKIYNTFVNEQMR